MATPTISSVIPALGHAGGSTLVEVVGTGFAVPPAPAPTGKTVAPPPSVGVTFGGVAAADVYVISDALLYCLTPKGDPDAGPVAVALQNFDAAGAPVSGELATTPAAFTFQRPDVTEESELARVVRAFVTLLKREVLANVSFSSHTDYDPETGDLLNISVVGELPALILGNLEVPEDRIHAVNEEQDFEIPGGLFIKRRPPVAVDVTMTLVGVTDNPITILNLMQIARTFFKKNPWLVVERDATDASLGVVRYELDWSFGGPVSVSHQADNSNVESFAGSVVIRGVILEDMPGISRDKPAAIPAHFPHEATTGIGGVTAGDATAVVLARQPKT